MDRALSLTSRGAPSDDGIVKLVVKTRLLGNADADLLAALDARAVSPAQRDALLRRLVPLLERAFDEKFGHAVIEADPGDAAPVAPPETPRTPEISHDDKGAPA
jgi:hypothetical protein